MDYQAWYHQQVLKAFNPLIHKILKRLAIYPNHNDYEDYQQELKLHLIQLADKFSGDVLGECRYQFVAYAQRGLFWHGLRLMKQFEHKETCCFDAQTSKDIPIVTPSLSDVHIAEFMQRAKRRLSTWEYQLIILLNHYSVQEIADQVGLSRYAIYKQRKKIQHKLADLKKLLA
ncbi:hypothetical protein SAMN04488558_1218 [Ignavigranum ruoffiae]|uniref:RNA polymerase sigma factor, sigma-70 family n=1 Tax=Ignavigranum ruoffiae TaxID=89093 RepID=A0A1H9GZZ6_9LACT|nr:sigma-70 family RNA polymerase sigma factor [Ignavigranum ruoffiae]SEQ55563.1 hypothetical protein SAMN04488558_1218 [Ignavigranum ruoffiae]